MSSRPVSEKAAGRPRLVRVNRYLLPREVAVAAVRKHPAVLAPPAAMAAAGLLVAAVLTATVLKHQRDALLVVWIVWGLLAAWLIWKLANWSIDYFVITNNRMFLTSGFFNRNVGAVAMAKVTDLMFRRSFAGRVLGFGELIVETAAVDQALSHVDHIPRPNEIYLLVCQQILFPGHPPPDDDL